MTLLLAISENTLLFIIVTCIGMGIILGEVWRQARKEGNKYKDSKVVNLDEYETFDNPRYTWRKKTTVNN